MDWECIPPRAEFWNWIDDYSEYLQKIGANAASELIHSFFDGGENDTIECGFCDVFIKETRNSFLGHISSAEHQKNLRAQIVVSEILEIDEDYFFNLNRNN